MSIVESWPTRRVMLPNASEVNLSTAVSILDSMSTDLPVYRKMYSSAWEGQVLCVVYHRGRGQSQRND
jgi:hypothetical protein